MHSESNPNKIFISHATPDDNEFSQWLAVRLMREGYSVWIDLKRLKVGDDFWRKIEDEIRTNAVKYILVLSKNSYNKEGVLQELAIAKKVAKSRSENFILPIRIDDLSFDDIPIEVNRLNAIDSSTNWTDGLAKLLEFLEEQKIPKTDKGPSFVTDWWKARYDAREGVRNEDEVYMSNKFTITHFPEYIYFHTLDNLKPFEATKFNPTFPVYSISGCFASFSTKEELSSCFEKAEAKLDKQFKYKLSDFITKGSDIPRIHSSQSKNIIINLMRQSFNKKLSEQGLIRYNLSGKNCYFWFGSVFLTVKN